jgi:glutathionylspermidine synthase
MRFVLCHHLSTAMRLLFIRMPLPSSDGDNLEQGRYAVIGSWLAGDSAHGMGIHEGVRAVTENMSTFLPSHFLLIN